VRRVKKALLGLVVFAVVYLSIAAGLSFRAAGQNAAYLAQLDRLDQLGTKTATELDAAPSDTLAQSCKAVPEVEWKKVLAYFPKTSFDVADLEWVPQRGFQTSSKTAQFPWSSHARDTQYFMYQLLSDFPPYWPMYLDYWDDPFDRGDLSDTKYLVVHQLTDVTRPRVLDENSYEAGELRFNSAVVDVTSGKVICAGSSVVTRTGDVHVTGHGKTDVDAKADAEKKTAKELLTSLGWAARDFALGEVCWIGGEVLCRGASKPFERPQ
jgi:hypothetical protein